MGNLNRIVNINIDIKTPAVSAASFDNLLIVGPAPATAPETAPPVVGSYTDLEGVTEAGGLRSATMPIPWELRRASHSRRTRAPQKSLLPFSRLPRELPNRSATR